MGTGLMAGRIEKRQSLFQAPHANLPSIFGPLLGAPQQPALQPLPLPAPSQQGSGFGASSSGIQQQGGLGFGQQQPLLPAPQTSQPAGFQSSSSPSAPSSWGTSYGPQVVQGPGVISSGSSNGLGGAARSGQGFAGSQPQGQQTFVGSQPQGQQGFGGTQPQGQQTFGGFQPQGQSFGGSQAQGQRGFGGSQPQGQQAFGGSQPQIQAPTGSSSGALASSQTRTGGIAQQGQQGQQGQGGTQAPQSQGQQQQWQAPPGTPPGFEFWFAEGTAHTYCSYGVNPVPRYNTPHKKCVPNHPECGIIFSCIIDVP